MTLEKLKVIIEAYTKPYKEEMEKVKKATSQAAAQVEQQTARVKNSWKKVGLAIASVLSIGAVVAFGKSCLELGSNLQEVQNVVDVTFGSMSGRVDEFAKNAVCRRRWQKSTWERMGLWPSPLGSWDRLAMICQQPLRDLQETWRPFITCHRMKLIQS